MARSAVLELPEDTADETAFEGVVEVERTTPPTVIYEMTMMGVDVNGYSICIHAEGYTTLEDAEADLRKVSADWEEQGVTPRKQDAGYSKNGSSGGDRPAVFSPGGGQGGGSGITCTRCGNEIQGINRKSDGKYLGPEILKKLSEQRGTPLICTPCFAKSSGR